MPPVETFIVAFSSVQLDVIKLFDLVTADADKTKQLQIMLIQIKTALIRFIKLLFFILHISFQKNTYWLFFRTEINHFSLYVSLLVCMM